MNEWINVKDKLPKENEDVLVFNSDGCRVAHRWNSGHDISWINKSDSCGCCDYFDDDIEYWMYLPEPPEKGK